MEDKKEAVEIKEIKEALRRIVNACTCGDIAKKLVAYEFLCTAKRIEVHGINYNNSFSIMDTETIDKLMVAMEDRYSELEGKYLCVCVAKLGASQKAIDSMVKMLADEGHVSIAVDLARLSKSNRCMD